MSHEANTPRWALLWVLHELQGARDARIPARVVLKVAPHHCLAGVLATLPLPCARDLVGHVCEESDESRLDVILLDVAPANLGSP